MAKPRLSWRKLLPGEQLSLWRRRKDLSQEDAVAQLGLKLHAVSQCERHITVEADPAELRRAFQRIRRELKHNQYLNAAEYCWLSRRRAGLSVRQMAAVHGLSHVTYLKYEHDPKLARTELMPNWGCRMAVAKEAR